MRWILLLICLVMFAACAAPASTPAVTTPELKNIAVATIAVEQTDLATATLTVGVLKNCPTSGPSQHLNAENPVIVVERKNGCVDQFTSQWERGDYSFVAFNLKGPDKLLALSQSTDSVAGELKIPGRADASVGAIGGDYILDFIGEDNAVIFAVVPLEDSNANKWSPDIVAKFGNAIASKNEDICGWLVDNTQRMVDLLGQPGVDIASYLADKRGCKIKLQPTLHPTPTSQWH